MDGPVRRLLAGVLLACIAANLVAAEVRVETTSNPNHGGKSSLWHLMHVESLDDLNCQLAGCVVDLTENHGCDHRFWSEALGLPRDMYVYLPPGYDQNRAYPLFVWVHGFGGDEKQFTRQVVRALDQAIVSGALPPIIAAAPDVSLPCWWRPWYQGSWCINGQHGSWEDYIIQDVLGFLTKLFKIRPEPEAHIIAGWSMGGFVAYNLGFKYPQHFRHLVGIYPNLNIRYSDRDGHWSKDFDPHNLGWIQDLRWGHCIGYYPKPYPFPVPAGIVYWPAWGHGDQAFPRMEQENPYELLDRLNIRDGQFNLYIAYGRKDEYNVDAQVDSFLHKAKERGIDVWVRFNHIGHHSSPYVNECMPDVFVELGKSLRRLLPDLRPQAAADCVPQSHNEANADSTGVQQVSAAHNHRSACPDAVLILPSRGDR